MVAREVGGGPGSVHLYRYMMGLPFFPPRGHFDGDWFQLHNRLRMSAKPTAWTDTRRQKLLTQCSHPTKTSSGSVPTPAVTGVPIIRWGWMRLLGQDGQPTPFRSGPSWLITAVPDALHQA